MASQLHQLLAVETSVAANFNRDLQETLKVLSSADKFQRTVTSKTYFSEGDQRLNTMTTSDITTTVQDRLRWFKGSTIKLFDLLFQKDKTNQATGVDLKVGDFLIATNVPAVTLLMLENKLQELRKVFEASPTLPAGVMWEYDAGEGYYKAKEPSITFSTKKVTKPVVLYEATDKHPAQVKEVSEDIPVAQIKVERWAGMITSKEKADLLGRLDLLLHAVKTARQEANNQEAVKAEIGAKIFDYLYGNVVSK